MLDARPRTKRTGEHGECLTGSPDDFQHDAYLAHTYLEALLETKRLLLTGGKWAVGCDCMERFGRIHQIIDSVEGR